MLHIKNILLIRAISLFLSIGIAFPSATYSMPEKRPDTLRIPSSFKSPEHKRRIYATLLLGRDIRYADSEDARNLLSLNHAEALLLSSGKYLVTKKVAEDELRLIRAVTHEDIEALMQIIAQEDSNRHQGIKELILIQKKVLETYYNLFPEDQRSTLPAELLLNDIIARAFELMFIIDEGMVAIEELSPEEIAFTESIRPIIMANKHNYFTQEFWNLGIRRDKIKAALNKGITFYQVAAGKSKKSFFLSKVARGIKVRRSIALLEHKDHRVRVSAAQALGKIADPQAIPALVRALDDNNSYVRKFAAQALGKIADPQAIPGLLQALSDKDSQVQVLAAHALGKIAHPQAVPALVKALSDRYSGVRETAAQALGEIGDAQAVPALVRALDDNNSYVRKFAAQALVKIGKPAIPALLQALDDGNWRDRNWCVRETAAQALGEIGDAQAVPALLQALSDKRTYVRGAAAQALGKIVGPWAKAAFAITLTSETSVSDLFLILKNTKENFIRTERAVRLLQQHGFSIAEIIYRISDLRGEKLPYELGDRIGLGRGDFVLVDETILASMVGLEGVISSIVSPVRKRRKIEDTDEEDDGINFDWMRSSGIKRRVPGYGKWMLKEPVVLAEGSIEEAVAYLEGLAERGGEDLRADIDKKKAENLAFAYYKGLEKIRPLYKHLIGKEPKVILVAGNSNLAEFRIDTLVIDYDALVSRPLSLLEFDEEFYHLATETDPARAPFTIEERAMSEVITDYQKVISFHRLALDEQADYLAALLRDDDIDTREFYKVLVQTYKDGSVFSELVNILRQAYQIQEDKLDELKDLQLRQKDIFEAVLAYGSIEGVYSQDIRGILEPLSSSQIEEIIKRTGRTVNLNELKQTVVLFSGDGVMSNPDGFRQALDELGENNTAVVLADSKQELMDFCIDQGIDIGKFFIRTPAEIGLAGFDLDEVMSLIMGIDDLRCVPLTDSLCDVYDSLKKARDQV